ncbi:uncharacterized protein LOC105030186 [Esox lucius]|uniref:uncharacterized protein LOC105030186 n=1 Tax=Esox lucius TaxID=8010 RepID=UPI000576A420|nr:uncharacterized protein LOC105030186 [Esox lucius]
MKANISLALSMLSLILLNFFCDVMPSPTESSTNGTQYTPTMSGTLTDGTSEPTDQFTSQNSVGGKQGNSTVMSTTLSVTTNEPSQPSTTSSTEPETTKKPPASRTSTTSPLPKDTTILTSPSKPVGFNVGSAFIVVIGVIILLLLLLGLIYKWATRQSDREGSATRLLLGIRERLRGWVRTLEEHLELSLWPWKRARDEEDGEGEEGGDREEGKMDDGGAGARGAKGGKNCEDEDYGDSSDDYSSLEGVDLRERAKNLEEEAKKEAAAKRNSGSAAGRDDTSGESDETDEEQERTGVTSGEEKSKGEMCDITIL